MKYNLKNFKIISIIIILILLFFSSSPIFANISSQKKLSDLSIRNLAMFASLAYADLENIGFYKNSKIKNTNINDLNFNEYRMVKDSELRSIVTSTKLLGINLSGEKENTYKYLFYDLASTSEVNSWKIVNYAKIPTTIFKGTAEFTAMTFKNGNNIVISYRGTDFDDIGDWTQDIFYGLVGYAGQEDVAKQYAIKVAHQYPNSNIYVTGHSLGGYLAQIGGSALIEKGFGNNIKEIGYFNGMGLFFWSNLIKNTNIKNSLSKLNCTSLTQNNSNFYNTQETAKKYLTNWYNNGGKLTSYFINGDLISALGQHCRRYKRI